MTIRNCFCMREVANVHVVVALGEESRRFRGILKLNDTAAFLYQLFSQGCEPDIAASRLVEAYHVTSDQADQAVATFVDDLKRYGLLNDVA